MITHPTNNDTQANINLVRRFFQGGTLPDEVTVISLLDLINQDLTALQFDNNRLRERVAWLTMPERMDIIKQLKDPNIIAAANDAMPIAEQENKLQKEVNDLKAMVEQLIKAIPQNTAV
jgi:hypothetical protein